MLDEKAALEFFKDKEQPKAQLVDARQQPDGSVLIFLDGEVSPSFKTEIKVTALKGVEENGEVLP